jgi:hypothetical protein
VVVQKRHSPDYQLSMFHLPESFRGGCSFGGL